MASVLNRLFRRTGDNSKDVAKDRLKLVLTHDRTEISPGLLEQLKDEIIAVIGKYTEFDRNGVEVRLTRGSREHRLVADIPLQTSRRRGRG